MKRRDFLKTIAAAVAGGLAVDMDGAQLVRPVELHPIERPAFYRISHELDGQGYATCHLTIERNLSDSIWKSLRDACSKVNARPFMGAKPGQLLMQAGSVHLERETWCGKVVEYYRTRIDLEYQPDGWGEHPRKAVFPKQLEFIA